MIIIINILFYYYYYYFYLLELILQYFTTKTWLIGIKKFCPVLALLKLF